MARNIRDTNIGASREVGSIIAGARRDLYMNAGNTSAAKIDQGVGLVNAMVPPGANKQIYVSQVDAAGQIQNAGLEAAKLRQAAAVISAVGREISREVGQGMRIRF